MSMLLSQAPRFSSAAALTRHYRSVKRRMASLAPPPMFLLPSPEMMARGNLPMVLAAPVLPTAPVVVTGELAFVVDIVPNQRLVLPEQIRRLEPEVERIAIRRAVRAATAAMVAQDGTKLKPSVVMTVMADAFKIDRRALAHPSRKFGIVRIRQIASTVTRKFSDHSLPQIGRVFGGRDHTTMLHGIRKFERLVDEIMAECAGNQIEGA